MGLFSHCKENNCAGNMLDKCSADKLIVNILCFTVELVEAVVVVVVRSTNSPLSAHYEATGYCMLLSEALFERLCTLYNIALFKRPKSVNTPHSPQEEKQITSFLHWHDTEVKTLFFSKGNKFECGM